MIGEGYRVVSLRLSSSSGVGGIEVICFDGGFVWLGMLDTREIG